MEAGWSVSEVDGSCRGEHGCSTVGGGGDHVAGRVGYGGQVAKSEQRQIGMDDDPPIVRLRYPLHASRCRSVEAGSRLGNCLETASDGPSNDFGIAGDDERRQVGIGDRRGNVAGKGLAESSSSGVADHRRQTEVAAAERFYRNDCEFRHRLSVGGNSETLLIVGFEWSDLYREPNA